jgi:orotate phosphoribosyltransferase
MWRIDMTNKKIIQEFFDKKIIQISTNPLFQLTSGKQAPVYIDHRKIFSFSELRRMVVSEWALKLEEHSRLLSSPGAPLSSPGAPLSSPGAPLSSPGLTRGSTPIVFAGTATAGIAPAYALAEHFQCGFVYVRNKPKEHGLKSAIEGVIPQGAQVIVIDDMITTGSSILSAVEVLRSEKIPVLFASSISRHNFKKTNANFFKADIDFISVFKTSDLFLNACEMGLITKSDFDVVTQWLIGLDEQE